MRAILIILLCPIFLLFPSFGSAKLTRSLPTKSVAPTPAATVAPSPVTAAQAAPKSSAPPSYGAAIRDYQENHFNQAFGEFQNYFNAGHDFSALDYNWGLVAYKLKKLGLAVGLLRRALFLNPDLLQARKALSFVSAELPQSWNENPSTWSEIRQNILDKFTFNQVAALGWLLFCLSGFLGIRYLSKRRKSIRADQTPPPFPVVTTISTVLFLIIFALGIAKAVAINEIRATVISQTSLRTGPSKQDNPIFDLLEGFDVSVKVVQNGWVQVSLESGQVGWIPASALFQYTGHHLLW